MNSSLDRQFQVLKSPPASSPAGVVKGDSRDDTGDLWSGLGLRRTRVNGRLASWRALINEVNASPLLPLPEYVSSCSSGNSSKGSPPSSNSRQRDSSSTSPSSTRRVFTFLNEPRSCRHLMGSA